MCFAMRLAGRVAQVLGAVARGRVAVQRVPLTEELLAQGYRLLVLGAGRGNQSLGAQLRQGQFDEVFPARGLAV